MKKVYCENKENLPPENIKNSKKLELLQTDEKLDDEKLVEILPNPFGRNINPNSVNTFDTNNMTLLYWSVKRGKLDIIKYLIENENLKANINLNLGKSDGKTPLYKALIESGQNHNKYSKIAEYLISHGAENSIYKKSGYTPLHLAATNCIVEVLQAFADEGHDFTQITYDRLTVVNLILISRALESDIKKALTTIPTQQVKVILEQTIINWNHPNIKDAKELPQILQDFAYQNGIKFIEEETGNVTVPESEDFNMDIYVIGLDD